MDDNDEGVGEGQEIKNVSKGLEIWGQQRRLLRRDDGPQELATTTEASEEEDETKVLTTTTEASIEEAEDITRLSERFQQQRRRCVYGNPEVSTATPEASIE